MVFILISKSIVVPGTCNIPKHAHVLTGIGFYSVRPHDGQACIEFTGSFCFVIILPRFNINVWWLSPI
jgi:hypothetical protein